MLRHELDRQDDGRFACRACGASFDANDAAGFGSQCPGVPRGPTAEHTAAAGAEVKAQAAAILEQLKDDPALGDLLDELFEERFGGLRASVTSVSESLREFRKSESLKTDDMLQVVKAMAAMPFGDKIDGLFRHPQMEAFAGEAVNTLVPDHLRPLERRVEWLEAALKNVLDVHGDIPVPFRPRRVEPLQATGTDDATPQPDRSPVPPGWPTRAANRAVEEILNSSGLAAGTPLGEAWKDLLDTQKLEITNLWAAYIEKIIRSYLEELY